MFIHPIHERQSGSVMEPKGAGPLVSAPLGIVRDTALTRFPDRNAVSSFAVWDPRDARVIEPRWDS
jgi:hypothetical protein